MMKYLFKILILVSISAILSSCNSLVSVHSRYKEADSIAGLNGFVKRLVKGDGFWITTYQRISNRHLPYVFYIEGDGVFYIGKYNISDDPTPAHPMLLQLATMDKRPNIVYIARPCQYTPMNLNQRCNHTYWTDRRMSEEVVRSINTVIDTVNNGQQFSIIGYSGGGGIAVLIAARNKNVKNIITISGNLDHVSFNKYHNARPMLGSLNPIDYVPQIRNIPQLHATGAEDTVIPPFIADKFVKVSNSTCVHQEIYTGVEHRKGWVDVWQYVLDKPLTCYRN